MEPIYLVLTFSIRRARIQIGKSEQNISYFGKKFILIYQFIVIDIPALRHLR